MEVFAAALLLDTHIYVYKYDDWLLYKTDIEAIEVPTDKCLYLENNDTVHINVVTDVKKKGKIMQHHFLVRN